MEKFQFLGPMSFYQQHNLVIVVKYCNILVLTRLEHAGGTSLFYILLEFIVAVVICLKFGFFLFVLLYFQHFLPLYGKGMQPMTT